jgi:hypothetical protein
MTDTYTDTYRFMKTAHANVEDALQVGVLHHPWT